MTIKYVVCTFSDGAHRIYKYESGETNLFCQQHNMDFTELLMLTYYEEADQWRTIASYKCIISDIAHTLLNDCDYTQSIDLDAIGDLV